jgi:hypothetical protein
MRVSYAILSILAVTLLSLTYRFFGAARAGGADQSAT